MEVACVNVARLVAVMEDGQELPVTNLFDRFGDETDNADDAITCVAGPDKNGMWVSIDLSAFDTVPVQ